MQSHSSHIKVGIDTLAIYTSRYALPLATLAEARGLAADKFHVGLGQYVMSVTPPGEDVVTMAANAAQQALHDVDINDIEMLLFATESGIDQSKAAGIYVHGLLGLPARCRVVELKQACYGGTAAIQLALSFLREHPTKKVLVIASDIARYGLGTAGESSQGNGAAAMILSAHPRILALEPEYGVVTENVMDFWRPNYSHEAFVDGKYSSKLYLVMLEKCWEQYQSIANRNFQDHDYFCYHSPVPRLVEKAHQHLIKITRQESLTEEVKEKQVSDALAYGRQLGNSYTASLYICLASLLDKAQEDLSGKRIGFYSYGSGCVAEYFSGVVQPGYRDVLNTDYHEDLLSSRTPIHYEEYEKFFTFKYVDDGSDQDIPVYNTGHFRLTKMGQHKRIYERVAADQSAIVTPCGSDTLLSTRGSDTRLSSCGSDTRLSSRGLTAGPRVFASTLKSLGPAVKPRDDKRVSEPQDDKRVSEPRDDKSDGATLINVFAPGKLILSGEHAVVYGQPALAMAVNRYVKATVTRETVPQVLFDLSDLSHRSRLSYDALHLMKEKIKQKYYRFISGDYSIRDVLQKPFELAQFAMGMLAESLNLTLPHGVKIQVQSDLPIGCGMGSSAATIVSVMQAMSQYMQLDIPQDKLYKLALEVENMQHGHSSGLDLRVAMQGGCLYMQGQEVEERAIPSLPMYLVNTGTPMTTTGQCVEKAAPFFKSEQLKSEFAAVTQSMDKAIQQQSWREMQAAIQRNHQLLVQIGVVPEKVQTFISQMEAAGGAAKICGAGAVAGDKAGAVLVVMEDKNVITSAASRFGYNVIPISGEPRGVYAA